MPATVDSALSLPTVAAEDVLRASQTVLVREDLSDVDAGPPPEANGENGAAVLENGTAVPGNGAAP